MSEKPEKNLNRLTVIIIFRNCLALIKIDFVTNFCLDL